MPKCFIFLSFSPFFLKNRMQTKKMKNQKRGIAQTRDFWKEKEQTQRRATLKKKVENYFVI